MRAHTRAEGRDIYREKDRYRKLGRQELDWLSKKDKM